MQGILSNVLPDQLYSKEVYTNTEVVLNKNDLYSYDDKKYTYVDIDTNLVVQENETLYAKRLLQKYYTNILTHIATSNPSGVNLNSTSTLPTVRGLGSTVSFLDYWIIIGGYSTAYSANVLRYDINLVSANLTNLTNVNCWAHSYALEDKFLVCGGATSTTVALNTVQHYDANLTKLTNLAPLSTVRRSGAIASNNLNHVYSAGGSLASTTSMNNAVDMYDENLTKATALNLDQARCTTGTNIDGYVIFAGGCNHNDGMSATVFYNNVDCYDENVVKTVLPSLPINVKFGRHQPVGYSSYHGYAIFTGGRTSSSTGSTSTYMYDSNLVRTNGPDLITNEYTECINVDDTFIIIPTRYTAGATLEGINQFLVKETYSNLTGPRSGAFIGKLDNYLCLGGGYSGVYVNTLETFKVEATRPEEVVIEAGKYYSFDGIDYQLTDVDLILYLNYLDEIYIKTITSLEDIGIVKYVATSNSGGLTKQQNATNLATTRRSLNSGHIADYSVIFGGCNAAHTGTINYYDTALTRNSLTAITAASNLGVSCNDEYLIAGGGWAINSYYTQCFAYNTSLTRQTITAFMATHSTASALNQLTRNMLFGGGYTGNGNATSSCICYNTTLTRTTLTALQSAKVCTGTSIAEYTIFAAGTNASGTPLATVDRYDKNNVKATLSNLTISVLTRGGQTYLDNTKYAIIEGDTTYSYAYDKNLIRTIIPINANSSAIGIDLKDKVYFYHWFTNKIVSYDTNLVRKEFPNIITQDCRLNTINKIGDKILIMGGSNSNDSVFYDNVEVVQITEERSLDYKVLKGSKYSFDNQEYMLAEKDTIIPLNYKDSIYIKYAHENELFY